MSMTGTIDRSAVSLLRTRCGSEVAVWTRAARGERALPSDLIHDETLDEFLAMPMQKVPGTTMPMMLPDAKERADVIAYLASLKKK